MADTLDVLMSWTRAGRKGAEHQERIRDLGHFLADITTPEDLINRPLDATEYPSLEMQVAHEAPVYYGLLSPQGIGVPHIVGARATSWNLFQNPVAYVKAEAVRRVGSTERYTLTLNLGGWNDPASQGVRGMGAVAARFSRKTYEPPKPDADGNLPPPSPPPRRDGWPDITEPILQNPDDLSEGTYETALSTTARLFIETPVGLHDETANPAGELELSLTGRFGTGYTTGSFLSVPRLTWTVTRSAMRYIRTAQGLTPADHVRVPALSMAIGKGSITADDLKRDRTFWTPHARNPSGGFYSILHSYRYDYSRPLPKILRADVRLSCDIQFTVDKNGRIETVTMSNVRSHLYAA